MELNAVLKKISGGFAPHRVELDDWGSVQYIIFDGQHIGVICEADNTQTPLPKIVIERTKLVRTAYAKAIGAQIFQLLHQYVREMREAEQRAAEDVRTKKHRDFQAACVEHIEQLHDGGEIKYDRVKKSTSTESVYLYRGKCRILRISTHGAPLKNKNYYNSIVITPDEVDTKLDGKISQLIGKGTKFFDAGTDDIAAWTQETTDEITKGD